jgi:hypothetical protein
MKNLRSKSAFLLFFAWAFFSHSQSLQGRVVQSVFYGDRDEEGQRLITGMGLDEAAVYDSISNRIAQLLSLDSIANLQYKPFVYSMGKYSEFETMSMSDRSRAKTDPADLYFKIFVDLDRASPTMVSSNLIKSRIILEIFVFDKNFQYKRTLRGKKSTKGITSSSEDVDLSFFELDQEAFWDLFNKALDDVNKSAK